MTDPRFPVVLRAGERPAAWEAAIPEARPLPAAPPGALDDASCLLIGGGAARVLESLRQVRRADPTLQPIVVATPEERVRLERGLLFTPGLGELWIVSPEEVGPALVERAAAVTRQRRAHLRRTRQVEHALATLEPSPHRRASISDAYLAALLDALPDPVVSVDAAGTVVSLNPAAERAFGHASADALHRPLVELVQAGEGALPDFPALKGLDAPLRRPLRFRGGDGEERDGELTLVPVDADGRRVYAVVFHDLTTERRTLHELEATAAELEAQAAEMEEVQAELETSHDELRRANDLLAQRTREAERARYETIRILSATSDAILGVDRAGLTTFVNPAAERLLGWTAAEMMGRSQHDLIHHTRVDGTPYPEAECPLRPARLLGEPTRAEGEVFWRKDGTSFPVEYEMLPLLESGSVIGAVVTFRDVTERRRIAAERERLLAAERLARREAERARAEAEGANRAKSEFLANMSHELRTPINAIIGYTDLLEMGITGPVTGAQRAQLARVRTSSRHLLGLINEVLDLAKVEAGQMTVARDEVALDDVIFSALALTEPLAMEKGLTLTSECGRDRTRMICGDEDRIRQILVNLLSNGVKFTEAGGRITIRCGVTETADTQARLKGIGPWGYVRIEDTGAGIAPEDAEAIFEPFVQAQSSRTRRAGGTGLGLTISRRLARLMNGDLTMTSRLGVGSCFTLWIPAPSAAATDAAAAGSEAETARLGLGQAGATLQASASEVMAGLVRRLREDRVVPDDVELSDADLEDHTGSLVSAIAQALIILEETGGKGDLMHDGSAIRRMIAERHGAQRLRLGWGEAALRREIRILAEELRTVLQRDAQPSHEAMAVLDRLLLAVEEACARGMRVAAAALESAVPPGPRPGGGQDSDTPP